jgi:histone H2A
MSREKQVAHEAAVAPAKVKAKAASSVPKATAERVVFNSYIYKLVKSADSEQSLNGKSHRIFNDMVHDLIQRVYSVSSDLVRKKASETLTKREVLACLDLLFPAEVTKHARDNAKRTITQYEQNESSSSKEKEGSARNKRAGLTLKISRVAQMMRKGRYRVERISETAIVAVTAVVEYVVSEVIDAAIHEAREQKVKRITPQMINKAIRQDEDLAKIFAHVDIYQGGVIPTPLFSNSPAAAGAAAAAAAAAPVPVQG